MPCQAIVCLFVLLGLASCVLATVRRGRASLLAAGLSAACLAALAFMLTGLAFAVALSNVVVGRAYSAQTRSNLLCAGLSRNGLLGAETLEHAVSAVCAFALALPVSALAALCLINALTMFGFYFEFMYNAAAAAAAGLAITAAYVLIPVVLGFRRGYGMRRQS